MRRVEQVVGWVTDPTVAERLHDLDHDGRVELVVIDADAARRRRLRVTTDAGTDLAIALDGADRLGDGAVLVLDDDRAVVVRLLDAPWIVLVPSDRAAALELGHRAGHLHWRVRFAGDHLEVAADGRADEVLARVADLVGAGRVRLG